MTFSLNLRFIINNEHPTKVLLSIIWTVCPCGNSFIMETGGGVTVSSSQLFDLLNSTVKSHSLAIVEEKSKWTSEEISRLIHLIVRPILIVIGTIGNCLSFYIMRRTALKDVSSCFYMSLLALADLSK